MGELITDEEIDMMISMVDVDGDGQVSFDEFYALVIHPDPATSEFAKSVSEARDRYQIGLPHARALPQGTADARAYRRQKDMAQRYASQGARACVCVCVCFRECLEFEPDADHELSRALSTTCCCLAGKRSEAQ